MILILLQFRVSGNVIGLLISMLKGRDKELLSNRLEELLNHIFFRRISLPKNKRLTQNNYCISFLIF